MAKTTAPLFSFTASGAIAKSLVFFPWKGIDAVRKYVVPTNPRSSAQVTQRGYVTLLVAAVHTALAAAANPLNSIDQQAYSLYASALGMVMTWFNSVVKNGVDQLVAAKGWIVWRGAVITPGVGTVTIALTMTPEGGGGPNNINIKYGLSKTQLINTQATTQVALAAGVAVAGLTAGTKYYFQMQPSDAGWIGAFSGIYHGTPT